MKRVILIVLDSVGIGELPDATLYNDEGTNTVLHIFEKRGLNVPNMLKLGLGNIEGLEKLGREDNPVGAYGRMKEKSKGKDTTTGHWEMSGVILDKAFPTYPNGFSDEINTFAYLENSFIAFTLFSSDIPLCPLSCVAFQETKRNNTNFSPFWILSLLMIVSSF